MSNEASDKLVQQFHQLSGVIVEVSFIPESNDPCDARDCIGQENFVGIQ
jgi:hypothetical protein